MAFQRHNHVKESNGGMAPDPEISMELIHIKTKFPQFQLNSDFLFPASLTSKYEKILENEKYFLS